VVESLIAKRAAGIKGGENLSLEFANGGFHFEFNPKMDAKVLTPAIRKAVDKAKAELTSGKLKLDWKSIKL
jgi:basic membrane lipoprotein Med (substrate-binding protein (PBP1-ABC) superfamily)